MYIGHKPDGLRVLFRMNEIRGYGEFQPRGRVVFLEQDGKEFWIFVEREELEKIEREDPAGIKEHVRMIRSEQKANRRRKKDFRLIDFLRRIKETGPNENGIERLKRLRESETPE